MGEMERYGSILSVVGVRRGDDGGEGGGGEGGVGGAAAASPWRLGLEEGDRGFGWDAGSDE